MITGAHFLLYSADADADRDFLGAHFGFRSVDAGGGWLIFALPPAELAVHPAEADFVQRHAASDLIGAVLYLMCDDVAAEIRRLGDAGVACDPVHRADWGSFTSMPLPSGGRIGLYQPQHPSPLDGS